jgi:ketosteroid isomerase-like protein
VQEILNAKRVHCGGTDGAAMSITREFAEAFFDALSSREPDRIAGYVADDADWLIVGPIELFPYCGQHYGKEAVLQAYGRMAQTNATARYDRDFMMTDGESASALIRLTDVQRATGREFTIRLAQFARFRDGKVCEFCSIVDTLGAAEQVMGRALIVDAPALAEV